MSRTIFGVLSGFTVLTLTACADTLPVDADEQLEPNLAMSTRPMRSSVHWLSDLSSVSGAQAQLVRTESSASFSFRTTGLDEGHVVTLWWVIFNNPGECANAVPEIGAACNIPDLFNPDVEASVMWAAGHVVGSSGRATFGGSLQEGEVTTFHPVFVGSPGLLDAEGAEIHLVNRTHGPLIPELLTEMSTTFEGGCTPESSLGFGDGPNTGADLQASAFSVD